MKSKPANRMKHIYLYSSVGKESTCNAEDPGSIPGLGRSAGEGIGYPLQYSWASRVAQLVKNLAAMQEILVHLLPGSGRSTGEGIGYPLQYSGAFLVAQLVKKPPVMGLIPRLGRSPGGGPGNPLQCSCLENRMDRGTWRATVHRVTKFSDTIEAA